MTTPSAIKKIAVLPGDGIGVEVTHEAVKVFEHLNLPVELHFGDIGWECWKTEGNPVPQRTWDLINACDVTLLGAITSMPKREAFNALPKALQEQQLEYISPIIQLRQKLDLYANVRPCFNVNSSTKTFNFTVIRENTEGLYAGFDYHPIPSALYPLLDNDPRWSKQNYAELSVSLRLQSKRGLTRLFKYAFEYAHQADMRRVTFADKPNVLRQSSAYARDCFEAIANQYPHINADILNVDAVALWMVRRPEEFGVIVAENMFGDILSDLGAGVMGGLGFAPSANIGEKGAYFEPVHGSAPRIESGRSNPSAMFLTCAMLLDHLQFHREAAQIRQGVKQVIKAKRSLTYDTGGKASTADMARAILDAINAPASQKTIAFLAIGSEFVTGDLLESNAHHSVKQIHAEGGDVRTMAITGDNQREISKHMRQLLDEHDALITIGGLGPTSDDNTRFALSDVIQSPLVFHEASWNHVEARLTRFGLNITEANRRQALFPESATILENDYGTANACHIQWQGRDIFMLPGPPKEYFPLFENQVLAQLKAQQYFKPKTTYHVTTLGLIEGEISEQVDEIANQYQLTPAYRWHYPYLDIKVTMDSDCDQSSAIAALSSLLQGHIVSTNGATAEENALAVLNALSGKIAVQCTHEIQRILRATDYPQLEFMAADLEPDGSVLGTLRFDVTGPAHDHDSKQVMQLRVEGRQVNKDKHYRHELVTPKREQDCERFIRSYFAWQLTRFTQLMTTRDEV